MAQPNIGYFIAVIKPLVVAFLTGGWEMALLVLIVGSPAGPGPPPSPQPTSSRVSAMSYLPPEKKDPKKISQNRIILWIVVGGIGLYLVISGVVGGLAGG